MTTLSEVAKIRQSIQQEIEASRQGLNGLATVARHDSINKRMGHLDELHQQLAARIGEDEATKFLLKTEAIVYDRQDHMASKRYHEKPTLMQVRRDHGLQSQELANHAGVPLRIEYQAEIGALITIDEAERILHALSHLTGTHYSLDSVSINVKREVEP